MRYIVLLVTSLFIACSSSNYVSYRPSGSTEAAWKIEAKWNNLTDHLTVNINGTKILDTGVSFFSGKGEAEGEYQGKKIRGQVLKSSGLFGDKYTVQIFVDEERAAEFTF